MFVYSINRRFPWGAYDSVERTTPVFLLPYLILALTKESWSADYRAAAN